MAMQWAPRLLGVGVSLFLALFALDAMGIGETILHLIPSMIVVGVIALSWRREWVGAAAFTALAVVYAVWARQHFSWIAIVSGPLLMVGALYAWGWKQRTSDSR